MTNQICYRLALLLPESRQVLGLEDSLAAKLPCISISTGERLVEQLSKLVEERWKLKAIVLDVIHDDMTRSPFAIMEIRSQSWVPKKGALRPFPPDFISTESLSDSERHIVMALLSDEATDRGPFARVGWLIDAQRWILDEVAEGGVRFNDDVRQFNAGGGFALARFGSEVGPAYWLKAVGEPNRHEFGVTKVLADLFPNHLPPVVAMRGDWHAWIMEEIGRPLSEQFTLPTIERAIAALAELQIASIDHIAPLLAAGCLDHRITVLKSHLSEIMEYLVYAMSKQTSHKVPRIEALRLREIACTLHAAFSTMQDLDIPVTLIHNDINKGNILLDATRCVFIDWSEACIGNPFFTFQHLCAQVSCDPDQASSWLPRLKHAYKRAWSQQLTESQIEQSYVLMPILGLASYLYGRGTWLSASGREDDNVQRYARSIARLMDCAARAPELLEALCA